MTNYTKELDRIFGSIKTESAQRYEQIKKQHAHHMSAYATEEAASMERIHAIAASTTATGYEDIVSKIKATSDYQRIAAKSTIDGIDRYVEYRVGDGKIIEVHTDGSCVIDDEPSVIDW